MIQEDDAQDYSSCLTPDALSIGCLGKLKIEAIEGINAIVDVLNDAIKNDRFVKTI